MFVQPEKIGRRIYRDAKIRAVGFIFSILFVCLWIYLYHTMGNTEWVHLIAFMGICDFLGAISYLVPDKDDYYIYSFNAAIFRMFYDFIVLANIVYIVFLS
jgi:hypothetical protein